MGPSRAQAGPKLDPSWAQAAQAGPKLGPSRAQAGPKPEIWEPKRSKKNMYKLCLFSLVGQWALFNCFGPPMANPCQPTQNIRLDKFSQVESLYYVYFVQSCGKGSLRCIRSSLRIYPLPIMGSVIPMTPFCLTFRQHQPTHVSVGKKYPPGISDSPERLTGVLKAFFPEECTHILGSPQRLIGVLKAVFFSPPQQSGPWIFGSP